MTHTEVKFTDEGISVSVYDGMTLVDEYWATDAEIEALKEQNKQVVLNEN